MTDGPHGVRADNSGTGLKEGPSTCFPTGSALAATWNPELIEQVGQALAVETLAFGCDILLGPCVNIVRTPLAGRNFEAYSEDPFLVGKIGVGWVRGIQSQGVGASLKHFAANNQEYERFRGSSEVDERTLREIYLAQFERIVKEADPWTVMCSYNRLNGVYASQNAWLLRTVLREEWGYPGVVVSDWGANHTTVESVDGGLDIEMPGPALYYGRLLKEAVRNWQIEEETVNESARRILRMVVLSGRMDQPVEYDRHHANMSETQALARLASEESITLLQNNNQRLPLNAGTLHSLAIIGPNAALGATGGNGSSFVNPPYRISPLEALRERLGSLVDIRYEPGCTNVISHPNSHRESDQADDGECIDRAVRVASHCENVVIFAGMADDFESEGYDRPHLRLPGRQIELIKRVAQANKNTTVVLNVGAPVELPFVDDVDAIVLAYYMGQEGGNALAKVLLGEINPSGKLPVTFPVRYEDNPTYINYPGCKQVRYGEGIYVGYRYYDKKGIEPLFPFGHGLSYTTFALLDAVAAATVQQGEEFEARVTVTNTGSRPGKTTVQLYVEDLESSLDRPVHELKGFQKVALEPGQSQTLTFHLDPRDLSYFDPCQHRWVAEPGEFILHFGFSSRDLPVQARVKLE
jgi:beta-glucosidase